MTATRSSDHPFGRWYVAATLCALGLLAIGLGAPRFMAGLAAGPQDETLRELAAGKEVPPSLIQRTAESRETALVWLRSGQYYSDLATLRMSTAVGTRPLSPERRAIVAEAIELQTAALTLAPADAFGWNRLLQAVAVAARPVAEVERILEMAIRRAPREPGLVLPRLRVGLLYWQGLSPAMRLQLAAQIRLAALWIPSDLVHLARARLAEETVLDALKSEPRLLARYNYARARL